MSFFIGIAIAMGCMLGGFAALGGHLIVIWQPYEFIIIGGSALGTFIVANPLSTIKDSGKACLEAIKGGGPKPRDYLDLLGLLYALMRELRGNARNELEEQIDNPKESDIFKRFPKVLADKDMTAFICDYVRLILIGNARTHEIEALMDEEIETIKRDKLKAYQALTAVSDGLPALGIVAAVLGIIKAMGALDQSPELLGELIGAALVGTFGGIFMSYGLAGPARLEDQGDARKTLPALHHHQADAARLHERGDAADRAGARPQDDLRLRPAVDRRRRERDDGRRQRRADEEGGLTCFLSPPPRTAMARPRRASPAGRPAGGAALLARAAKLKDGAERVTASVVKSLQVMAGTMTTIEGMVAGYATDNARAVATGQGPDTAVGAIELPGLGCNLLVTLDTTLVHGIVELLCGGNGVEPPPVAPRAVTPIDQQFAQIVFALAASAIQTEWAEFGVGAARAAKIEGPLNADIFGARVETVGLVNMTIGLFGLHGTLRLVLPPKALDRFAGESPASDAAGPEAADPAWSGLLRREIERAPVALAAFLDAKDISLGALAALKTGQILALPVEGAHAGRAHVGRSRAVPRRDRPGRQPLLPADRRSRRRAVGQLP